MELDVQEVRVGICTCLEAYRKLSTTHITLFADSPDPLQAKLLFVPVSAQDHFIDLRRYKAHYFVDGHGGGAVKITRMDRLPLLRGAYVFAFSGPNGHAACSSPEGLPCSLQTLLEGMGPGEFLAYQRRMNGEPKSLGTVVLSQMIEAHSKGAREFRVGYCTCLPIQQYLSLHGKLLRLWPSKSPVDIYVRLVPISQGDHRGDLYHARAHAFLDAHSWGGGVKTILSLQDLRRKGKRRFSGKTITWQGQAMPQANALLYGIRALVGSMRVKEFLQWDGAMTPLFWRLPDRFR